MKFDTCDTYMIQNVIQKCDHQTAILVFSTTLLQSLRVFFPCLSFSVLIIITVTTSMGRLESQNS